MDGEIVKEYTDSTELSVNAKGEVAYKVKAYGDAKTPEGREKLAEILTAMEKSVWALAQDITQRKK